MLSLNIVDYPEGFDPSSAESFLKHKDSIPNSGYLIVLLAHALGTLVGGFIVGKFVSTKAIWFALGIGAWFLMGGIAASFIIPAPKWFVPVDFVFSYLPMGLLGWFLAGSRK